MTGPAPTHFADRLVEATQRLGASVCVGFDPVPQRLPAAIIEKFDLSRGRPGAADAPDEAVAEAFTAFGRGVIEAVASLVPAIKINIAFFEPYREAGLRAYHDLIRQAHEAGLLVIGDVKRADIGHSAERYARAHLGDPPPGDQDTFADAITVNPYFGRDGVQPFIDAARTGGRGVLVLVQTSNPTADQTQGVLLSDGSSLVLHVAQLVQEWAADPDLVGTSGYSLVGAVVAPRDRESTLRIRTLMPDCLFLVPGFGAQGRTADDVAACFKPDGTGAVVNASRSVIYAFSATGTSQTDWQEPVRQACRVFVSQVRKVMNRPT